MRMMLKIVIPTETGNKAIKDGSLHEIFEAVMSKLKPEAAYFFPEHGLRSAMMIFSTYQVNDSGYSCDVKRTNWGGYMSRAHGTVGVRDDAIIAFLLFCLEIYQAEQQRKRTLH